MAPGGSMITHQSEIAVSPQLRARNGFTMIEVIVASVILGAALLAMAGFTVRYQHVDATARILNEAQQAANERLERVRTAQPYLSIDTMATTESSLVGYPGYVRQTIVTRVGGAAADTVDYKIVTVRVTTPGVARVVSKTSFVGAF
jgi:prepilin-type N-terminal cleavage/methylation domain-containing protein